MSNTTGETRALALINSLTTGVSFDIPVIDLNNDLFTIPEGVLTALQTPVARLTIDAVTTGTVDGNGAFDMMMKACKAHLRAEYDAGRITGAEYTKAYTAMMESALANATQFALGRDQSYWEAQKAQLAAFIARAELEKQRLSIAMTRIEANTARANYARAVISLATAEAEYDTAAFNLTQILPQQVLKLTAENVLLSTQNTKLLADTDLVEKQALKTEAETTNTNAQTSLTCAQKANVDAQTLNEPKKGRLIDEQAESTRAQTLDNRLDGATVTGVMGKQKDLYSQQITAYERDAEVKAAKIFTDAWITQKTIDEGLTAPPGFTNASIDQVLSTIRVNNGLIGSTTPGS